MKLEDRKSTLMHVIDNYSNMMLRTAGMIVKDFNLAEDITQETLIKFYYSLDQFRGESSIKTYLFKILVNECRQSMRKNWFKRIVPSDRLDGFQSAADSIEDLVEKMSLSQSILKLDPIYREVILLHYYNDLSIQNISNILKTSEGTVKSRLKRGRNKLKIITGEAVSLDAKQG